MWLQKRQLQVMFNRVIFQEVLMMCPMSGTRWDPCQSAGANETVAIWRRIATPKGQKTTTIMMRLPHRKVIESYHFDGGGDPSTPFSTPLEGDCL
tara:strand:+ start:163 stop:447 length:285 start_codon:yes stop_codon:yes gene_type:complete